MFEQIYFLITAIALVIATYTDLKERIVQNKLIIVLAAGALALKIIESYLLQSPQPLVTSAIGTIIAFAASLLLYKLGVWASGDVKLVSAIAIANPINYAVLAEFVPRIPQFFPVQIPVFGISLIIYSALCVFPMGLAMVTFAVISKKKLREQAANALLKKIVSIIEFSALAGAAGIVLPQFGINNLFAIPAILIFAFLPRQAKHAIAIAAFAAGIFLAKEGMIVQSLYISIPLFAIYALITIYMTGRAEAFKEKIPAKDLQEGMILDSALVKKNGKLEIAKTFGIKSVINHLMNYKIQEAQKALLPGKYYASPLQANGLEQEQADEIKALAKKGHAPKEFTVKKTMPFIPAILAAYILLELTGDILWNILL